jgi:hypothetical protein
MYDPVIGRFIQADSMVEDDATQGLNRYTYCLNNPFSRIDPSGQLSFKQILGAAIGIIAGIMTAGVGFAASWVLGIGAKLAIAVAGGFLSAYVSTGSLRAGLWGALSAAVFFGIGQGFKGLAGGPNSVESLGGLSAGEFAGQVACHAAAGGALNVLQGGKFGHGFLSAGISKALSPAIESFAGGSETAGQVARGAIASAVVGGTVSVISGGKFGNAAAMGMFSYLFNQVASSVNKKCEATDDDWKLTTINRKWRNKISVTEVDGVVTISGTLTISAGAGIDLDAVIGDINLAWTFAGGEYDGKQYISKLTVNRHEGKGRGDYHVVKMKAGMLANLAKKACNGKPLDPARLGGANVRGGSTMHLNIQHAFRLPAHEFGHALGLSHAPKGSGSIMSYDDETSVTGKDIYNLSRGY